MQVVAGVEAADAHRVETRVLRAGYVGHAGQRVADGRDAVGLHVLDLDRVDGLGHVAGRRLGARGSGHLRYPGVIGADAFNTDRGQLGGLGHRLRECGRQG
ncbi:hypothetical protein G6F59_017624 [Rhizopus arrhizus]|nr:hypothetical protein G6F59_017624 [Rhizopus arrhizus]